MSKFLRTKNERAGFVFSIPILAFLIVLLIFAWPLLILIGAAVLIALLVRYSIDKVYEWIERGTE